MNQYQVHGFLLMSHSLSNNSLFFFSGRRAIWQQVWVRQFNLQLVVQALRVLLPGPGYLPTTVMEFRAKGESNFNYILWYSTQSGTSLRQAAAVATISQVAQAYGPDWWAAIWKSDTIYLNILHFHPGRYSLFFSPWTMHDCINTFVLRCTLCLLPTLLSSTEYWNLRTFHGYWLTSVEWHCDCDVVTRFQAIKRVSSHRVCLSQCTWHSCSTDDSGLTMKFFIDNLPVGGCLQLGMGTDFTFHRSFSLMTAYILVRTFSTCNHYETFIKEWC